jgi:DNA-binding IclR family transcriptional regulator
MGKALLAFLPAADQARRIDQIEFKPLTQTIVTREDLISELAVVQKRGYAIDDEENESGVRCVRRTYFVRAPAMLSLPSAYPPPRTASP